MGYRQIIFDCDGVLVDTNGLKMANIRSAVAPACTPEEADAFVDYFVRHNGVPREDKIARFFQGEAYQEILNRYNALNRTTVPFVTADAATVAFVERLAARSLPLYVLSGGDEAEVRTLLENAGLAPFFHDILGGPTSKVEHLERLGLSADTCYFGDSRYDYQAASRFGFDFVFLSRYTQFQDWELFFSDKPDVTVTYDFSTLNG